MDLMNRILPTLKASLIIKRPFLENYSKKISSAIGPFERGRSVDSENV